MVLGFGAPDTLAQQTEKWHTYHKPLEFSIDYPDFKGQPANITETIVQGYPVTYIDAGTVFMIINKSPLQSLIDPQEIAVLDKQNLLKISPETIVSQDIFTSLYDGELGYTYVTNDPINHAITAHTFVKSGPHTYEIDLSGMSYYNKSVDNFNYILNSIKFFH